MVLLLAACNGGSTKATPPDTFEGRRADPTAEIDETSPSVTTTAPTTTTAPIPPPTTTTASPPPPDTVPTTIAPPPPEDLSVLASNPNFESSSRNQRYLAFRPMVRLFAEEFGQSNNVDPTVLTNLSLAVMNKESEYHGDPANGWGSMQVIDPTRESRLGDEGISAAVGIPLAEYEDMLARREQGDPNALIEERIYGTRLGMQMLAGLLAEYGIYGAVLRYNNDFVPYANAVMDYYAAITAASAGNEEGLPFAE